MFCTFRSFRPSCFSLRACSRTLRHSLMLALMCGTFTVQAADTAEVQTMPVPDVAPMLVANPPERHVVVTGDTLWSIAGKFLQEPWRWPELWQLNRADIQNPHRIYPGDVVILDTSGQKPRLRLGKGLSQSRRARNQYARTPRDVAPRVYDESVDQVIPSIPSNVIEPFISHPALVEPEQEKAAPTIIAASENRVFLGAGDNAFAKGINDDTVLKWHIFRPGKPLVDPETKEVIAHEAFFLGSANLQRLDGDVATLLITNAKQEIGNGDRLMPARTPRIISYVPHRPDQEVKGRVISIYGGASEAGAGSVVALNRGQNDGLEVGHVLALYRTRTAGALDEEGKRQEVDIPPERYALVFVFSTFDKVSYALVMDASRSVIPGDKAVNP